MTSNAFALTLLFLAAVTNCNSQTAPKSAHEAKLRIHVTSESRFPLKELHALIFKWTCAPHQSCTIAQVASESFDESITVKLSEGVYDVILLEPIQNPESRRIVVKPGVNALDVEMHLAPGVTVVE